MDRARAGQSRQVRALQNAPKQMAEQKQATARRAAEGSGRGDQGADDYDFMDPEARQQFQELLDMLQQQMMQQTFQGMQQALSEMTPEDIAEMRQMMHELNEMLRGAPRASDPDFEEFMDQWGHFFGPGAEVAGRPVERMQQQMAPMQSADGQHDARAAARATGLMQAAMQDHGLQQEMARLARTSAALMHPRATWRRGYQFSGDESLSLERSDAADGPPQRATTSSSADFSDVRDWNDLARLDDDKIRDLLGEEAGEQMRAARAAREDAGRRRLHPRRRAAATS